MPDIVVIAGGPLSLQLALAGLAVESAANAAEAEQILEKQLEEKVELIVVEERFQAGFSERFKARLDRHRRLPLVVYCPSFEQEHSEVDEYLASVLGPAVGYEIRLE